MIIAKFASWIVDDTRVHGTQQLSHYELDFPNDQELAKFITRATENRQVVATVVTDTKVVFYPELRKK